MPIIINQARTGTTTKFSKIDFTEKNLNRMIERGDIIGVILGEWFSHALSLMPEFLLPETCRELPGSGYSYILIIWILACILILSLVWGCMIYMKYAVRRDRVLKKIEEIQKGPSETLALLGLTMMVPIAPGILDILFCHFATFSIIN